MARRHQAGAVKQGGAFKGRQVISEVILWAVRWYLMFPISYRDLELMLADRGVDVDHTTIFRWIQAYAPELEKRIRPHLRMSNGSWRVDLCEGEGSLDLPVSRARQPRSDHRLPAVGQARRRGGEAVLPQGGGAAAHGEPAHHYRGQECGRSEGGCRDEARRRAVAPVTPAAG